MTDREKAFVMHGLRNHIRLETGDNSRELIRTDQRLRAVAERLGIPPEVLEQTQIEQTEFLAVLLKLGAEVLPYEQGN